jgi:hypothetical protein
MMLISIYHYTCHYLCDPIPSLLLICMCMWVQHHTLPIDQTMASRSASTTTSRARPPAMVYDHESVPFSIVPLCIHSMTLIVLNSDDDIDYTELPAAQRRHMLEGVAHVHERKGSAVGARPVQHMVEEELDDDNDGVDEEIIEEDINLWDLFKPMGQALGKNIILV